MATFHFDLVSPENLVFSGEVEHVVVPGTGHYLMLEQPVGFNCELAAAVARSTAH